MWHMGTCLPHSLQYFPFPEKSGMLLSQSVTVPLPWQ